MLKFAFLNLLSRPGRSLLALLGLTVAIAGMVGLFSVAAGLDQTVGKTFGKIVGIVAMQPGAPIPLFSRIPAEWADEVRQVPGVRVVRPEVWVRAHMIDGRMTFSPPRFLFGCDIPRSLELKATVYRDDIVEGRFLSLDDIGTNHCLISRQISLGLHKGLGQTLRVDGHDLEVVGIYDCGSLFLDVAIICDEQLVRRIGRVDSSIICSMYIEADDPSLNAQLIPKIQAVFRGRELEPWQPTGGTGVVQLPAFKSGVPIVDAFGDIARRVVQNSMSQQVEQMVSGAPPGSTQDAATTGMDAPPGAVPADEAIEVRSARDWGERIEEFSTDLDVFLWLMTGIGVVIALLSILNTMLMSVTERIIEFGVLRANGWRSRDVLQLIAWESALIGICGGVLGCVLGWIGAQIVNWAFPAKLNLYASPELLVFSLCFSTGLGIVGGLYPAWWAVRLSPMDAIRRS